MPDIAIKFDNISKRYEKGSSTIRESIAKLFRGSKDQNYLTHESPASRSNAFWALKDVNFEVKKGNTLGIIGPNGAGKSTILKLLAGITEPTTGKITINGKIGVLIELGAGFHPEFTGRENIYLNGAIMGMGKKEINEKFDNIVDFAELQEFIDTPVKHYSSGMYVRLGFSIAAHLEPDILLIDEVLAVGDASFQAKCLKKIGELKQSGVIMVLVSHNLHSIRILCDKTILLNQGNIIFYGETETAINNYTDLITKKTEPSSTEEVKFRSKDKEKKDKAEILEIEFLNNQNLKKDVYYTGEKLILAIKYLAHCKIDNPVFTLGIYSIDGILYAGHSTALDGFHIDSIEGYGTVKVEFEHLSLLPGIYEISVGIFDKEGLSPYDWHQKSYRLHVVAGGRKATGLFYFNHRWQVE
ncbi:MAG: hypothetical protein A2042_01670 [Candidatus Schekmanbacteria bacterium GWA2_38_11]|uniref:ABC transporter domain-containing protein n=1 Tax=Candidatus Schekmanbacteria bacterium GWA2_38_11 TaxID=1817876 RepID=A0A1F7RM81_9BACT|nr:MAG: hypothetical protein A2042_01670 [Candidatus Schekmanbacteria bacterium GWA2_38_11]